MNKKLIKPAIVLGLLVLWQLVSMLVDNRIIMASPLDTGKELLLLCRNAEFYRSIFGTLGRVFLGFGIALVLGFGFAMLAEAKSWIGMLLEPVVNFFKAVPVAAIVVLLLIWFGSQNLAIYISFMVVFPSIYISMREGLSQIPLQLEEMAKVFSMPKRYRYRFIVREAFLPHLKSAMKLSMGMSFKSGIAAEIIGLTGHSIGEQLYFNKISLNTPGIFSWIVVILLLDLLVEKGILRIFDFVEEKRSHLSLPQGRRSGSKTVTAGKLHYGRSEEPATSDLRCDKQKEPEGNPKYTLVVENLEKNYHGKELFHGLTMQLEAGKCYCIMGASGCGKTTLFRIFCDLTSPDNGNVQISAAPAVQFQEQCLCPNLNAWENISIANSMLSPTDIRESVAEVIDEKWLDRPVREYSGGMQRKVAFLRALLNPAPVLLLDEPFTGLDEENRSLMMELLTKYGAEKTILFSTHVRKEASLLGAEIIDLERQIKSPASKTDFPDLTQMK
ncbi:MAG: ATP-binding cassette domain-containing protein [Lachnospiraceae bacterium]